MEYRPTFVNIKNTELKNFNDDLFTKEQIIALNKIDLLEQNEIDTLKTKCSPVLIGAALLWIRNKQARISSS